MAIQRTTRRISNQSAQNRPARRVQTVQAGTSITSGARRRNAAGSRSILATAKLSPEKQKFARQLQNNGRRLQGITAATNTANIMARPDFIELMPMFVQQLIALDICGSVAMNSRQQLVPYFKFIAENAKGETAKGTILSSPFVNRQGVDPNFTGKIVKNEVIGDKLDGFDVMYAQYLPILPGSVTASIVESGVTTPLTDDGQGNLKDSTGTAKGFINYSNGNVQLTTPPTADDAQVKLTYQYDNETVGPDEAGQYGAKMAKGYLQLDEINLIAEAREIACYWSIYSAFAAQTEYGGNIGDMAKEAAIGELTAEINTTVFEKMSRAASVNPQFNWNAAPVLNGSVVPSDYLNMLKLKLNQAAAYIYQTTNLSRPNRIICGTNAAEYIGMINGFVADNNQDTVGPYHAGRLDNFEVYVAPSYDPDEWVMGCKSSDIRRNSMLFGEYMPIMSTDQIGLANMSVQSGHATMFASEVVNPASIVKGKLLGTF